MKVVEAIWGASNLEEEEKPGLSVFSLDSPGGRKRNGMMTTAVSDARVVLARDNDTLLG